MEELTLHSLIIPVRRFPFEVSAKVFQNPSKQLKCSSS
jgi:hypothetical protein